jgi:hypothetical protein
MVKKEQSEQSKAAEYGHALLSNRGGWTLREMFGSDSDKFSGTGQARFTQKDFQESVEKASGRVPSPTKKPKT